MLDKLRVAGADFSSVKAISGSFVFLPLVVGSVVDLELFFSGSVSESYFSVGSGILLYMNFFKKYSSHKFYLCTPVL